MYLYNVFLDYMNLSDVVKLMVEGRRRGRGNTGKLRIARTSSKT